MTLPETLFDRLADRPRLHVDDLRGWWTREAPTRRLLHATGRIVDITHRPSLIVTDSDPPVVEHELGRAWLAHIMREQRPRRGMAAKRVPWSKPGLRHLEARDPKWWGGTTVTGEWAYVDLVAAYPSIYTSLALDCQWRPDDELPRLGIGRFAFLGADEMDGFKGAHRAIGGAIRSTRLRVSDRGEFRTVDTTGWSPYLAPDLWGVIAWTLHAVARMAIDDHGAVMVATDAYVVPLSAAAGLIRALADDWGLRAVVKYQGAGTVWGVGSYRIGDRQTVQTGRQRRPCPRVAEMTSPQVGCLRRLASHRR